MDGLTTFQNSRSAKTFDTKNNHAKLHKTMLVTN